MRAEADPKRSGFSLSQQSQWVELLGEEKLVGNTLWQKVRAQDGQNRLDCGSIPDNKRDPCEVKPIQELRRYWRADYLPIITLHYHRFQHQSHWQTFLAALAAR